MNTTRSLPRVHERSVRWLEGVAYTLLLAWALCWATFAVLSGAEEGLTALPYATLFMAALAGTVLVVWRSVRAGAVLLFAVGAFSLHFFSSPSALLLFAVPAFVLGILFVILAPTRGHAG